MSSLLNLDQPSQTELDQPGSAVEDPVDFEFVLGPRQMAGTALLLIVVLAVFSGVSYLVGKTAGAKEPPAPAIALSAVPDPVPAPAPATANSAAAPSPTPAVEPPKTPAAPIFAQAETGKLYLQVGAIDKGLAGVFAEGLRTHGLDAFVSPGPNQQAWRVLIGPLPDQHSYDHAKGTLDSLGVAMFARKYTQ